MGFLTSMWYVYRRHQQSVGQSVFTPVLSGLAAFAAYPDDGARYCWAVSGTVIILEVLSSLRYPVALLDALTDIIYELPSDNPPQGPIVR